jgi:hypothetical protein
MELRLRGGDFPTSARSVRPCANLAAALGGSVQTAVTCFQTSAACIGASRVRRSIACGMMTPTVLQTARSLPGFLERPGVMAPRESEPPEDSGGFEPLAPGKIQLESGGRKCCVVPSRSSSSTAFQGSSCDPCLELRPDRAKERLCRSPFPNLPHHRLVVGPSSGLAPAFSRRPMPLLPRSTSPMAP